MASWQVQIDNAATADEVLSVARDYFALWSPEELARLPAECRPGRLRDASDLEDLNRAAVDAFRETRAGGEDLELLQKLTAIVGRACIRLAQLRDRGPGAGDPRWNPAKSAVARER